MSFEAYIQRADNYITKQIHKFEQQKRGNRSPPRANGYHQMSHRQNPPHGRAPSQGGYPGSPTPPVCQQPTPPVGPTVPEGWAQEYDSRSQRWYYVEKATGRSQWNPPSCIPPRSATFQPDVRMPSPYQNFTRGDEERSRIRSNSQPQRPGSNGSGRFLDSRQSGDNGGGSPGLHTQLPPGAHFDMKTGKVVSSMFPEGQSQQSWAQEIQRI
ncbi:hypothetical protein TW65_01860 [Stemphylium lycopersici]|nr:hypothetical protein TW65_01860 [Stemphylium lycopersici]